MDRVDFFVVDIETKDLFAAAGELKAQRQANVTKSDDGEHKGNLKKLRVVGMISTLNDRLLDIETQEHELFRWG